MKQFYRASLGLCFFALLLATSCTSPDKSAAVLNDPLLFCATVKKLNNVVLENNFPPMIASRNYAYATIAAYEVVAAGDPAHYQSLAGQIKHLPALPKPADTANIDFHLAALLAFTKVGNAVTFPEGSMMDYYDELLHMADSLGMPEKKQQGSRVFADTIAARILAWSKGDNYAQTRSATRYTVNTDSGRWVPTPPMYAQAIEPHWSEIRPMVLDSASMCRAEAPPAYNMKDKNGVFYKSVMEVKQIGDSLTDEQKHIADFWDDNPFKMNVSGHVMFATKKFSPPGHWMNIVGIAAKSAGADFNTTVAAYAKTAITLFDAFIGCWEGKYKYNYIRPETVINQHIDPEWRPYIQTPPFPSFPSGHGTVSAAAAETMTSVFGDKLHFTDTSLLEFGIGNREITSFRNAAKEAAMSRLYGGIHFRFDNELGAASGRKIGELVVSRLTLKK
ncbi:vanadium-dependent haloperoxidase [Flavihumibacter profundi]|uniref:vanadium-dependent haloperoxidase n=1 Tax=Flavihumibacter profundi TaxID=2716883 RepID=UPI001CC5CD43|nr:vanadium-dependent haloperoxidase [Flavihumibacter profundi]MBZ5857953.1 vanadium-dependent haloperoxidase [Flavihumibacter profundi]